MGVGAVRTCNRVVTLPTSVGAVLSLRTCKRGGDFAHWRRCRSDMQADGGRYEPGDGATTGRSPATAQPGREGPGDGGGDAGWVGARRRSRHRSGPCDKALSVWYYVVITWVGMDGGSGQADTYLALCSTAHRVGSSRRKPWLAPVEYLKLCSHEAQNN